MSRRERDKGQRGEREVAQLYRAAGFEVRGLEGGGDHLVVCDPVNGLVLHSEVKRQETARPWAWHAQELAERPEGALGAVHFRRNASPWLVQIEAATFVAILARAYNVEPESDAT